MDKSELGQIDGLDMWKTISEGVDSPRNELIYNIDDVLHYAAVRQGEWKYTTGSTSKGKTDKWFGDSGKNEAYFYDKNAILNSKVASALAGIITYKQISEKNNKSHHGTDFSVNFIDTDKIDKLRDDATIKCKKINLDDQLEHHKCSLKDSPCLFNIKEDPCERINRASERPNIVLNMEQLIMKYRQTALPPRNVPRDPNADPAKWNNTWTNWQDCENVVKHKLSFNSLPPLAIGLISAAALAVIAIVVVLLVLNCRHSAKRSRPGSLIEEPYRETVIPIPQKGSLFEERELQVRSCLKDKLRTVE